MPKQKKEVLPKEQKQENFSKTNPSLHHLYTMRAVTHLALIEECVTKLEDQSNLNMMDILSAMCREYDRLIETNAAYKDAKEILDSIRDINFRRPNQEQE